MSELQKILFPLAWLYGCIISIRNIAYDLKFLPLHRAKVPVISVGNLTVGGTGKTPLIEYLLRYYINRGNKVCVISRGYKRQTKDMYIVSDGTKIYGTAISCGDEPYQIAKKFPHTIVVVDEKRIRAVEVVMKRFLPDIILLDDGFQHRSLARDLDIVMVDGKKNLAKIPMLPAGYRREPLSALKRAGLIAFNHVSSSSTDITNSLKKYSAAPSIGIKYQVKQLNSMGRGESIFPADVKGATCVAFCGVGNPQAFKASLTELGIQITNILIYPDHHYYSNAELSRIQNQYETRKAKYIVTTEKDAVRLQALQKSGEFPWQSCYYLDIEVVVVIGEGMLKYTLKEKIDRYLE